MKLIDRQDAIDAIDLSRVHNTHEDPRWSMAHEHEHRHFMKMLYDLPTVDAIPVQWLYALAELAEKKESETDIKLSLMIKGVVALWRREQEK